MERQNRRSSILKKPISEESSPTQTFTRSNRRISFSEKKFIKEFLPGEEVATIWGNSYDASTEGSTNVVVAGNNKQQDRKSLVPVLVQSPQINRKLSQRNTSGVKLEKTSSVSHYYNEGHYNESLNITLNLDEIKNLKFSGLPPEIESPPNETEQNSTISRSGTSSPNIYCSLTLQGNELEDLRTNKRTDLTLADINLEERENIEISFNENITAPAQRFGLSFQETLKTMNRKEQDSCITNYRISDMSLFSSEQEHQLTNIKDVTKQLVAKSINPIYPSSTGQHSIYNSCDLHLTLENDKTSHIGKNPDKRKTTYECASLEMSSKICEENNEPKNLKESYMSIVGEKISTSIIGNNMLKSFFNNSDIEDTNEIILSTGKFFKDKLTEHVDPVSHKLKLTYESSKLNLTLDTTPPISNGRKITYSAKDCDLVRPTKEMVYKNRITTHENEELDLTFINDSKSENRNNPVCVFNTNESEKTSFDMDLSFCMASEIISNSHKTDFVNLEVENCENSPQINNKHPYCADKKSQNNEENLLRSINNITASESIARNVNITEKIEDDFNLSLDSPNIIQTNQTARVQRRTVYGEDILDISLTNTEVKESPKDMEILNNNTCNVAGRRSDDMDLSTCDAIVEQSVFSENPLNKESYSSNNKNPHCADKISQSDAENLLQSINNIKISESIPKNVNIIEKSEDDLNLTLESPLLMQTSQPRAQRRTVYGADILDITLTNTEVKEPQLEMENLKNNTCNADSGQPNNMDLSFCEEIVEYKKIMSFNIDKIQNHNTLSRHADKRKTTNEPFDLDLSENKFGEENQSFVEPSDQKRYKSLLSHEEFDDPSLKRSVKPNENTSMHIDAQADEDVVDMELSFVPLNWASNSPKTLVSTEENNFELKKPDWKHVTTYNFKNLDISLESDKKNDLVNNQQENVPIHMHSASHTKSQVEVMLKSKSFRVHKSGRDHDLNVNETRSEAPLLHKSIKTSNFSQSDQSKLVIEDNSICEEENILKELENELVNNYKENEPTHMHSAIPLTHKSFKTEENILKESSIKNITKNVPIRPVSNVLHSIENILEKTNVDMEWENYTNSKHSQSKAPDPTKDEHHRSIFSFQSKGENVADKSSAKLNYENIFNNKSNEIASKTVSNPDEILNCGVESKTFSEIGELEISKGLASAKRGTIYNLDDLDMTFENEKNSNMVGQPLNKRGTIYTRDDLHITVSDKVENENEVLVGKENMLKIVVNSKEDSLSKATPSKSDCDKSKRSDQYANKNNPGPSFHFQSTEANDIELSIVGQNNEIEFNRNGSNIVLKSSSRKSNSQQKISFRGHEDLNISVYEYNEIEAPNSSIPLLPKNTEAEHTSCKSGSEANLSNIYCPKKSPKKTMFSSLLSQSKPTRKTILFTDDNSMSISPDANSHKSLYKNQTATICEKGNLDIKSDTAAYCTEQGESIEELRYDKHIQKWSKSKYSDTNSIYLPNTTEDLCNIDFSKITDKGYRKNFEDRASLQRKRSSNESQFQDILNLSQDEIEKTKLSLVDSLNLTDPAISFSVCATKTGEEGLSTSVDVIKNETHCLTSGNIISTQETICRRCKNCRLSLTQNTTDVGKYIFALNSPSQSQTEVDYSMYDKLKDVPSIKDVLAAYKKRRTSNNFKDNNEESVLFPTVPTFKFLMENYENEYSAKVKSELEIGAILPLAPSLEFLLKNKIKSECFNWKFNELHLPIGLMEFKHSKISNISLLLQLPAKAFYSNEDKIIFDKVVLQKTNKFAFQSSLDTVIQKELFSKVPCELTNYCSCLNELFDFLEYIHGLCESSIKAGKDLLKVAINFYSSLETDQSGNCFIKKSIRTDKTNKPIDREFLVQIRNITKISYQDVILPPISDFNESIYSLAEGLQFLKQFLSDPIKFLR